MLYMTDTATISQIEDIGCYEFRLAVTNDSLVVINSKKETIEKIICRTDHMSVIVSCPNEDTFLDTLEMFKNIIKSGQSPKQWVIDNL